MGEFEVFYGSTGLQNRLRYITQVLNTILNVPWKFKVKRTGKNQDSDDFCIFAVITAVNSAVDMVILGGAGNHEKPRPTPKQIILPKTGI